MPNNKVCGIDYKDLYLVRVQGGLDGDRIENGGLVLNRSGSGRAESMNTTHFTINTLVRSHSMGKQFDGSTVVIIAPLEKSIREAQNYPSGLSAGDTWIHADENGDLKLPGAQVLVPDNFSLSPEWEKVATRYPHGATPEETMSNRNQAVSEMFQRMEVPYVHLKGTEGMDSITWDSSGYNEQCAELARFARDVMPGRNITIGQLHMNDHDAGWDRNIGLLDRHISAYAEGKRLVSVGGTDLELYPEIENQVWEAGRFIADREKENINPRATEHYKRGLTNLLPKLENLEPIREKEIVKGMAYDGKAFVRDGGGRITGPFDAAAVVAMGLRGELKDKEFRFPDAEERYSLYRDWSPYKDSQVKKNVDSIHIQHPNGLDNIHYCAERFVKHATTFSRDDWRVIKAKEDVEYVLLSSKISELERRTALNKIQRETGVAWEREKMPEHWSKPGVEEWYKRELGIIPGTKLVMPAGSGPLMRRKPRHSNYAELIKAGKTPAHSEKAMAALRAHREKMAPKPAVAEETATMPVPSTTAKVGKFPAWAPAKLENLNGKIGAASIGIGLVDAGIKGDMKKAAEVAGTGAALHYGMKGVAKVAGVRSVPIAGQIVGAGFAGMDTYASIKSGNTGRAVVSGIETTLYSVSAVSGAAAAFNFWNPVGWGAGAVAAVSGGAAVAISAGKGVYDNWGTVKGWFGNDHAPMPAQEKVLQNDHGLADKPRFSNYHSLAQKGAQHHVAASAEPTLTMQRNRSLGFPSLGM